MACYTGSIKFVKNVPFCQKLVIFKEIYSFVSFDTRYKNTFNNNILLI